MWPTAISPGSSIRLRMASPSEWPCCICLRAAPPRKQRVQNMAANRPLLLRGARVVDPSSNYDGILDVLIENGVVRGVARGIAPSDAHEVRDVDGMILCPGFIDVH